MDQVNKPNHYQLFADGTEAIDVIEMALTFDEYVGYLKGNALKYRLRAGKKDNLQQDIAKAENYEARLAKLFEDHANQLIASAPRADWERPPQAPVAPYGYHAFDDHDHGVDSIPSKAKDYCGPLADCSKCPWPCK